MQPCIHLINISFSYRNWFTKQQVLETISLEMLPQQMIALTGTNGSGKSTLLKIIAGFIQPTSGKVVRSSTIFGYVSENVHLPPSFSARQYLHCMQRFNKNSMSVENALAMVNLSEVADKKLATFSKGMRQRCMFALLVLQNADLVLLDEPFSGLDRDSETIVKTIIAQWKKAGKTIIYTTHEKPLEQTDTVLTLCNATITVRNNNIHMLQNANTFAQNIK